MYLLVSDVLLVVSLVAAFLMQRRLHLRISAFNYPENLLSIYIVLCNEVPVTLDE